MRIAIAGKGGTGKTTIAGTLARVLARAGRATSSPRRPRTVACAPHIQPTPP